MYDRLNTAINARVDLSLDLKMDLSDLPPLISENPSSPQEIGMESDFEDESDDEMDTIEETTSCLFCEHTSPSVEASMDHVESVHKLNFLNLKQTFQMDQYSFLKLINCIRKEKLDARRIIEAKHVFWDDEKYLKPLDYEPWLTYDYETLNEPLDAISCSKEQSIPSVEQLQKELQEKSQLLEQAYEDMVKMREGFQRLFKETDNPNAGSSKKHYNSVSTTSLKVDDSYFSSYAHFGIHHEMLSDTVRTTSYRDALLKNKDFISGKDVLDVGCGTSVLSIFASQAGAQTVVGIDNSDIIYNAMDIVKKNKISNVRLIKGRLEDTHLPQQKFDFIISEWMGYFLLFEGMLDTIIYARDNHLKEDGMLLPNRCTMSIVGYGNDELYAQHVTFWNDVYGVDMSNMRKEVMHEPLIDIVDPKYILTASNTIADLDLAKVDLNYSDFMYNFKLKCLESGMLSAIIGYFETFFNLPVPVSFSTSPKDKPTHWKQVIFFINEPRQIKTGDVIDGKLKCRRSKNTARSLDITIEVFNQLHTYYLD